MVFTAVSAACKAFLSPAKGSVDLHPWIRTCRFFTGRSNHALPLQNVQHVVAVASGKGGVGKSTLAGAHPLLVPLENHRVRCMSMGFFTQDDTPVVWRGPIVNSAIEKFVKGTDWGALDILIIDMPPGTGDAQITLGQRLPLSGAVIVSTPQDVALIDARRGAQMFRRINVPILGIVENMSYYRCKNCGHQEDIFGHGGVTAAAQELGVEMLGEVPLDVSIRVKSDQGAPIVISDPLNPSAVAYIDIARRVHCKLVQNSTPMTPKIVVTD